MIKIRIFILFLNFFQAKRYECEEQEGQYRDVLNLYYKHNQILRKIVGKFYTFTREF